MVAGAAGHDAHAAQLPYLTIRHGQVAEHHAAIPDAAGDGAGDGVGLLVDLLEHEVVVAAFFRSVHIPVDVVMLLFDGAAALVIDADAAACDDGQLAVVHVHDIPCVAQQRRHVGGDEVLSVAVAQQQRRVLAGGNETVRRVGADDAQRVGALHGGEHAVHCLEHVAAGGVIVVQQLGHHLRVRLGAEGVALGGELGAEQGVVLDDAVVDNGEQAALADLGMGVDVVGLAMGGPAGMAHAQRTGEGAALLRQIGQRLQAASGLADLQALGAADSHARRVVAAVLQTAQAVQQDGGGFLHAHVSHDSTHI